MSLVSGKPFYVYLHPSLLFDDITTLNPTLRNIELHVVHQSTLLPPELDIYPVL